MSSALHVLLQTLYPSHLVCRKPWAGRDFHVLQSPPDQKQTSPANNKAVFPPTNLSTSLIMEIDMLLKSKFTLKYNERQICLIEYLKNQMKPGFS